MEVIVKVASHAGFCFGVKRAVNMAFDAASNRDGGPIYSIGPLIHNPQVVKKLESMGICPVVSLDEAQGGRVIIRSHGVPPSIFEQAERMGVDIIDATCPFVKKAQEKVAKSVRQGFWVFIVGDKEHPEVQALLGYGGEKAFLLDEIPQEASMPKVVIVCQTTQSEKTLVSGVMKTLQLMDRGIEELRIYNTICESTQVRQKECRVLAEESDVVIVVGGKNSANTTRLAEISRMFLGDTYHIEDCGELDPRWFRGKERVGVTAGASTPDWIIGEVVKRIKLITGGSGEHGRKD